MPPGVPAVRIRYLRWKLVRLGVRDGEEVFERRLVDVTDVVTESLPADPDPGERPVFGRHRQPPDAAETAPAWPSLATVGRRRIERYRRQIGWKAAR